MPRPLIVFALLFAGCGGPQGSPGDATQSEFREMQRAEERVDRSSGPALDPDTACDDDCAAGRAVCAGAGDVCGLARRLDDPDATRRCEDARRRCDSARATAAPLCACGEALR